MTIDLSVSELPSPVLEFGGAASGSDIKEGLLSAGPFDMRFGSARPDKISVGLVGPGELIDSAVAWLDRCENGIGALREDSKLRRSFDGFSSVFRKKIVTSDLMTIRIGSEGRDLIADAIRSDEPLVRFTKVLGLYDDALKQLASREINRPDIVLVCIPPEVRERAGNVTKELSDEAKAVAKSFAKRQKSRQLDLLDLLETVEEGPDDLIKRDLHNALKAKALQYRLPIQIVTRKLLHETNESEDPATRAWNFSVGLYYKSGGVPWRLRQEGPQTCFVGVTFHHVERAKSHIVRSSLAHAFSSDGEGFAIRGGGVPVEPGQALNVHLSYEQAFDLGERIISEYRLRTGAAPLRVVVHKTSDFDDDEREGFQQALADIPIVSLITLTPSPLRLFRFGVYPPKVGTVFSVNDSRTFLYTTGLIPEVGTYPGPHIPQPVEIRGVTTENLEIAARDALNLTRMNWNTADLKGRHPITMSFARRVGGILTEFGDEDPEETSFRYFV